MLYLADCWNLILEMPLIQFGMRLCLQWYLRVNLNSKILMDFCHNKIISKCIISTKNVLDKYILKLEEATKNLCWRLTILYLIAFKYVNNQEIHWCEWQIDDDNNSIVNKGKNSTIDTMVKRDQLNLNKVRLLVLS